jgi:hypothetical protein
VGAFLNRYLAGNVFLDRKESRRHVLVCPVSLQQFGGGPDEVVTTHAMANLAGDESKVMVHSRIISCFNQNSVAKLFRTASSSAEAGCRQDDAVGVSIGPAVNFPWMQMLRNKGGRFCTRTDSIVGSRKTDLQQD